MGWVFARGPTWTVASSLWATFWVSTRRVRYSSPWLRALFLGGSLHLDIAWVTRLVAAVLRPSLGLASSCCFCRGGPFCSSWSQNAGASYRSCSTQCSGRLEGLGLEKIFSMWQAWGEVPSCLWSNFSFFGYQEHSFVDLVRSRHCHGRIGCHFQSGYLLSYSFVVSFFYLPVGVRGALDSGSTSLGSVRTVLVLFLLNRLVLFLLDLVGPKKLPALMRSWRFDAGWLSAKTAFGTLRNPETKVLLCATSTYGVVHASKFSSYISDN